MSPDDRRDGRSDGSGRTSGGGGSQAGRSHLPRPSILSDPEDEVVDRPRQRISSSPLKRMEGEEKELERRSQPVHLGLRLTVMGVVVLGLFSIMIVRLWSLQVLQGPAALKAENALTTRTVYTTPPRGLILSRDGVVLVANKVMPVVTLNRQDAANDPGLVQRVAVVLGITVAEINADLDDQQDSIYEPVPVAVGVSASTILTLSEDAAQLPGVTVSYVAERTYPQKGLGVQMLGYVSDINSTELKALQKDGYLASDVIGQAGVEAQYESFLRGKPGTVTLKVDSLGDAVGTQSETPATPGDDVVLNVDEGLEAEAQKALSDQLASLTAAGTKAKSGAVVVLDPQNGAVLAMVSLPNYNPEWWVGGMSTAHWDALKAKSADLPLLDRAINGTYQPGSSFKLATATAALEDGVISPYTLVSDPGHFTIPHCSGADCTFYNNAGESCGSCNVTTALTMSDDVFFYTMGYDFFEDIGTNDSEGIQQYAAAYGFGSPTGVDLPGEASGQVDGPLLRKAQHKSDPLAFPYTYYGPGDALQTAFGQGETLVTPLQLANAYATFANGGTRYAPQVAAAVLSPTGKVVKVFKPKVEGHVTISAADYSAMLAGFEGVITKSNGTAYATFQGYKYSKLPIAGKTGTATTSANPNAQPTAVFVAFGPVSTDTYSPDTSLPQYCVAAVIPGAGYGASAAAPVVRAIFQYLIKHPIHRVNLRPRLPAG